MNLVLANLEMPVRITTSARLDDDELMEFCAANGFFKIERTETGELRVMTPAGGGTGSSNAEIIGQLRNWSRSDGRGVFFDSNTGFSLKDGAMLSPDGAWLDRGRWLAVTKEQRLKYVPACPNFVIELRSPSDRLPPLKAKMAQWIANGAEVGWLIDPVERSVAIYRRDEEPETLFDPSSVQGTGPVLGFELVMSWVWGEDRLES